MHLAFIMVILLIRSPLAQTELLGGRGNSFLGSEANVAGVLAGELDLRCR
jgi:hypothetical protein